jgi:hypothetical protein
MRIYIRDSFSEVRICKNCNKYILKRNKEILM